MPILEGQVREVIKVPVLRDELEDGSTRPAEKRYSFWEGYINTLVGKLLTIVDAIITDKQQKEAVKDLVKNTIWSWAEETSYCERCNNRNRLRCSVECPKTPHQHYCPDCNCYANPD